MTTTPRDSLSLPGPRKPALFQTLDWVRRPVEFMLRCRERYGKRFRVHFVGGRTYIFVSEPADVKALLTAPPEIFASANKAMEPFIGQHSMFVLEGDRHRHHRRIIGPPLKGDRLRAYGNLVREITEQHLARWPVGQPFPILPEVRNITLQVIFRAIFGVHDDARLRRLTTLIAKLSRLATPALVFLPFLRVDGGRWTPWGRFIQTREEIWKILRDEIAHARSRTAGREDILAKMIDEGTGQAEPLTDDEILHELITLLGAGHETSMASLGWAFQFILDDAAVYKRIRDEVRAGDLPLSPERLERMPYLDAAIYETLRYLPIIPITPRLVACAAQIGDIAVPAGTYVTACSYLTHRDDDIYPDAGRFSPDRFLDKRPNPFEWFPFGGGHRFCIGGFFALYEMKAVIASIIARADVSRTGLRPQKVRRHGIILEPDAGTPIVVERRL